MKLLRPILLGGLSAGTLDIVYATLAWSARGVMPQRTLQSIASGLLGKDAYQGGWSTALLGLGLHYFIATGMAAGFVILVQLWPAIMRRKYLSGSAYGLAMFAIMNYVVMPLSAIGRFGNPQGWMLAGALFAHIVLVGLSIALVSGHYLRTGNELSAG